MSTEPLVAPALPKGYYFAVRKHTRTSLRVSLRKRIFNTPVYYTLDYWYADKNARGVLRIMEKLYKEEIATQSEDKLVGDYPPKLYIGEEPALPVSSSHGWPWD